MPSKANGYYVVGRCSCGELLTTMLGTTIHPRASSVYLRHVSNNRRECSTPLAHIAVRRVKQVDEEGTWTVDRNVAADESMVELTIKEDDVVQTIYLPPLDALEMAMALTAHARDILEGN